MAPEGFEGQSDARSDVYALGLTLYELLALRPAFDEKDRHRLIRQVIEAEPPRLGRLEPGDPARPGDDRAQGDRPGARPTATRRRGDLADDLRRFLEDRPIQARRHCAAGAAAALGTPQPGRGHRAGGHRRPARRRHARLGRRRRSASAGWRPTRTRHGRKADRGRRPGAAEALPIEHGGGRRPPAVERHQRPPAPTWQAAPPEYRHWEWRHFAIQLDSAWSVLRAALPAGVGRRPQPGRPLLASGSQDGRSACGTPATGRARRTLRGHADTVTRCGSARTAAASPRPVGIRP